MAEIVTDEELVANVLAALADFETALSAARKHDLISNWGGTEYNSKTKTMRLTNFTIMKQLA